MALILDILNQLQLVVDYSSVIEYCFPETLRRLCDDVTEVLVSLMTCLEEDMMQ